jgi:O-antigen/teichoic acid export membrane protein
MDTKPQIASAPFENSPSNLTWTILSKKISKLFSDEGLTQKAYLNAVAAALDYGARFVTGLLINPVLVAGLGDYWFGAWQILSGLIGYISAASGRPTQTLKLTIANQQASTDYEGKRSHVGSAVAVWLLFFPVLTTVGTLMAWYAPDWLNAPAELYWIVRLTAGVLVANLIMTNLVDVPESTLRGENLGYKRMGLTTLLVFVQTGVIAAAVYLETGVVGVAVASLINTLLTGALFFCIVRSYIPWFGIARPSLPELRRFFGLSWWVLAWRLVIQLMMASDVVVLGRLDAVEKVTTYTLTTYIPQTLITLIAIIVSGVLPGLGGLLGAGKLQKATRVRSEIMTATWLVAIIVGTTVLLWNRAFIRLWVGEEHYAGSLSTLFIMLMIIQFVFIRNDANIIDFSLDMRDKVLIGGISAVIGLVLAGILVGPFNLGIIGLCLGLIGGRSILTLGYPLIIGRLLGVSLGSELGGMLRPACVTVMLFSFALGVNDFFVADSWVTLIPSVGLTVVLVSLLAFFTGISFDQRSRLWNRVQVVIGPVTEA